ncbi:hypothetical protein ABID19_003396 [Mesorhizobium robiniae]|uniref:YCII-related domain-containing protein n=1 Tax=Mesorhizobium robiniae TaxID=559315 RepID=A0ABV2GPY7_9HYPH
MQKRYIEEYLRVDWIKDEVGPYGGICLVAIAPDFSFAEAASIYRRDPAPPTAGCGQSRVQSALDFRIA